LSTATNPIGVFPFHPTRESTVRGSRRRRRCCAGPREDVATPVRRRRARGGVRRVARRTGRRRGREPGAAGARTGAAEYITGVNTYTTGGIYFDVTPSPFSTRLRLHRRPNVSTTAATLSLSSLLEPCFVLCRRRWGAPSCRLAWLPAFEPQNCRVASVWCSRATHAPGPADAMRGPLVNTSLRAERAVQGVARRRVASRCARITRRPRRANGLERESATRALGARASGELHAGPLASRATKDAAAAR
jgi:hypothetical protein